MKKAGVILIIIGLLLVVFWSKPNLLDKNNLAIKEVNQNINVMNLKLLMPEKEVLKTLGYKGEEAMCVSGYEYKYDQLELNVGFNIDTDQIRRITVTNEHGDIYGIKKGLPFTEASSLIKSKGFTKEENSLSKFKKDNIRVTIISQQGTSVDGVSVEIVD